MPICRGGNRAVDNAGFIHCKLHSSIFIFAVAFNDPYPVLEKWYLMSLLWYFVAGVFAGKKWPSHWLLFISIIDAPIALLILLLFLSNVDSYFTVHILLPLVLMVLSQMLLMLKMKWRATP